MSTYRLQRRLSHADVDFLGELKVAALLGLLEQAAVEASAAAGYDAARYTREDRVWIIRRTQLQRFVAVGGTDVVDVETSVQDFRRARSLRHYRLCRDGTLAAQATTDWVYCDMSSGRPVRIPVELQHAFHPKSETPLSRPESLPKDPDSTPQRRRVLVQPSHLDHVVHVNNGIYIHFLEDAAFELFAAQSWPLPRMLEHGGALRLQSLDVEYFSDARLGDEIEARTWLLAGGIDSAQVPRAADMVQTLHRSETEILRATSHWIWRRRPEVLGAAPNE